MPILSVIGTRPEAIKMAPLINALRAEGAKVLIYFSGQHTLEAISLPIILQLGEIDLISPPRSEFNLGLFIRGHISKLRNYIKERNISSIIVHGDTATAFSSAIIGNKLGIPIIHIEAGLRTHCKYDPFPEETYRYCIDSLATLHFPPTAYDASNLHSEGIHSDKNLPIGNTIVDCVEFARKYGRQNYRESEYNQQTLKTKSRPRLIVTCHRRGEFFEKSRFLMPALSILANSDSLDVMYVEHPSPKNAAIAKRLAGTQSKIQFCKPMDYLEFSKQLQNADIVITDSGGIEEECYLYDIPNIILRHKSERPYLRSPSSTLAPEWPFDLQAAITQIISNKGNTEPKPTNILGEPGISTKIAREIARRFS